MGSFIRGFVLPFLLLSAGLLNWSLISLVNLVSSLVLRFAAPKRGFHFKGRALLWFVFLFSVFTIFLEVVFLIVWAILGAERELANAWWMELIGLMKLKSWRSPIVIYLLVLQLLAAGVTLFEINSNRFRLAQLQDSRWEYFLSVLEHIGSRLRVSSCLFLPAVQLIVGISYPSWLSLPFFICSCVGLVDLSLTSNFLGLFRGWKLLWLYSGFNICLLYFYQLDIPFPQMFYVIADYIGLYRISANSDWQKTCSGLSLLAYYYLISFIEGDLEEMYLIMTMREGNLTERLLPSRHSFFVRQYRSGVRHTNVLLKRTVFRIFTINFFTYGFPISLFALSFWSFHFASVCAFGLLAYVGYILYAFPSLFRLHRLNGLLLVFILLWAVSTYIFNVAFVFLNWKLGKDMEIWEMVGLWRYSSPGLFLLAQFFLGILVAVGNLVNNSVFLCLSDEESQSSNDSFNEEVKEETKVLIVATVAWGLRKCSRAIMLVLIFIIATKPGFIHAVYLIFFFVYLLSHDINEKMRQSLILLCEAHFAVLYILQLNLITETLEHKSSLSMVILSQLGLLQSDSYYDFLEIAVLACFCAVHNHGFDVLFSFSAIVQHAPCPPVGFSILKAGLNKSVLLSVYASSTNRDHDPDHSHEKRIASYLSAIGQRFLSVYRSFGTYIAFITILITVYLVTPNYVSFGYIFLLLLWIIGRQLVEKTKRRLWYPLKVYAISVFVLIYSLSIFPTFEAWVSRNLDIQVYLGYHHGASLLENVWQSLAIVIVMQMYSYERRQSKYFHSEDPGPSQFGVFGFIRRFLIWHSQKILFIALFYASLSPISAFGFFYLLGLVLCSTLPKASRIPSKLFLIYTGLIVATEYLFQMWGKQAGMFPGQKHYALSVILGLEVYRPSFWGLEAGLRAKVLVIAACTLQYNVFHWLEKMPASHLNDNRSGEPCPLFVSEEDVLPLVPDGESKPAADSSELSTQGMRPSSKSWPYLGQNLYQSSDDVPSNRGVSEYSNRSKYSFGSIWGSRKESHKWNKRLVVSLRKERLEMQKTTLKIYLKFWVENMFNLFGLEINMLALLLASFALLNAVSLLYIALLASCVLLKRRIICKVWPIFVLLFTLILLLEYFAMWKSLMPLNQHPPNQTVHCHDCWSSSDAYFDYCKKCWLGFTVDDPRTLISYYVVFMLACFKLRADRTSSLSGSFTYRQMVSQRKNSFVWRDLSFETKSMWTFLDYLRLYCYCHLLDLVLALILITGTLEYDVLHLGYLGFALIFFRMRLTILKKKNEIFKYLRMYNFTVIVLSLAYQSPFIGDFNAGKCETIDYIYEVIGFYKYDYGFRITSRSALVEIIIFVLVSLQSYMFSSPEFEYVFRYLEAEQIGAVVREQEKKAAWKTAQLQYIRESEEKKRQRNLQVEKMKSEMLNLQIQLHSTDTNSAATRGDTSPPSEGIRRRRNFSVPNLVERKPEKPEIDVNADSVFSHDFPESPNSSRAESPFATELMKHPIETPLCEISEVEDDAGDSALNLEKENKRKGQSKDNPLVSAVQLIGDGVSQVQSIGNQAVNNIVSFLNIPPDDSDSNETSTAGDGISCERDSENTPYAHLDRSSSLQSDRSRTAEAASLQIGRIFCHMWSQIRSNYDVVCYCGFLLVFLWNFSLLSMVYLAALFLYALCVNTGPSYIFWVIMLIYTEIYILIQYLYQIIIQHCGFSIQSTTLQELGFPTKRITSAFVVSSLPLFLVYLFTLIQSSITAKDGEWFSLGYSTWKSRLLDPKEDLVASEWSEKVKKIFLPFKNMVKMVIRGCSRYWKSLTQEAESPPYFVQLSMDVHMWPEDGIQPERIESGINELLKLMHDDRCKNQNPSRCSCSSRVQIQSIEKSSENPNIALAVFEVVYACPLTECTHEQFKSLTPAADIAKEIRGAQSIGAVEKVGFPYRILSIIGGGRREVDLYAYIFGADLSVFFLVAIFYQSVKKNKSDFLDVSQLEDQFPEEYVFILMAIFFLIVVDRIIYLCSFATGKVIFYMSNLFLFTYVVTEYAWNIDAQQSAAGLALRAIYLTKAISLALQAIQIRYGVPHKSTLYRQFLTSKVSQINYLGYRLYRALPFLYELRCVLDWSCTRTSLTMYDWLKLEDINASLYLVKCDAVLNRATHKQGEKQTKMTKFCNGICLFFVLICVIWAPMLMYSSGNPTNIANPVNDVRVQLDIKEIGGGRLTLYQTTLCEMIPFKHLHDDFNLDPNGYLYTYNINDIQLICCQPDANTLWLVPDVVQRRFILSLRDMDVKFSWVFTRDRPKDKEVVKYERTLDSADCPKPSEVKKVLNGSTNSFRAYNLYPRYFRLTGSGEVRTIEEEANGVSADIILNRGVSDWWSFHDINSLDVKGCGGLRGPMAIIVSEETPQGLLGDTLSKFSIWGLYITFVLAVGRFIRLQCSDLRMRIPYENLPSCDRLIAICEDIYAARAEGELVVEEVLYWTLVKIYRSPHMLLEYTKPD
ncbi:Piezo-type mechanosensitive ion channel -like protein [Capsicum annuum]|uniref:piezo-type mechanosensitive ion channel homolog isoform X1 n=1 Tax=Capsicum annuum TaxID=4072 RepID=UPI0007BF441B|nr:piezo-type mechanosensitive ion channel homolog isoform X1 [Capsicum annuum]KAF3663516.1 Piezo-type mechanosensitive ion channel -like protein [Capsicum annuum]